MPKRTMDTAIWADPEFDSMTRNARYLFFYLHQGPETELTGAMRSTAKRLGVLTDMSEEEADAALSELVARGWARTYDGGWIWLPKFLRHQVSGPAFLGAARRAASRCPDSLRVAIGRELDRIVAEKPKTESPPEGDKHKTRNGSYSRKKRGQTPPSDPPTDVPTEEGSDFARGQGQGQRQTYGLSVVVGDASPSPAKAPASASPDDGLTLDEAHEAGLLGGVMGEVAELRRLGKRQRPKCKRGCGRRAQVGEVCDACLEAEAVS